MYIQHPQVTLPSISETRTESQMTKGYHSPLVIISLYYLSTLKQFGPGSSSYMHILRLYATTVFSFISIWFIC